MILTSFYFQWYHPQCARMRLYFHLRFFDLLNLTRTLIRTSSRQVSKARVLTFEFYTFPETLREVCGRLLNSELQVHGQQSKPFFCSVSSETETEAVLFTKRVTFRARAVPLKTPSCPGGPVLFTFVFNFGF